MRNNYENEVGKFKTAICPESKRSKDLIKEMDAGEIIYQYNIALSSTDTLLDLEKKRKMGIQKCIEYFTEIL